MAHVRTIWMKHPPKQLIPASGHSLAPREESYGIYFTQQNKDPLSVAVPQQPLAIILCSRVEPNDRSRRKTQQKRSETGLRRF